VNALSGDTSLFAEVDEKYGVYKLKELYELHNQGHKIRVPTLLNGRGNKGWVEVENIVSYGNQSFKRITLSFSRLYVEISENAIIPAFSPGLFSGTEKQIYLKFKRVNEIKVTQDMGYNDTLLLATRIPLNIPIRTQNEWDYGFALGYWLAEGSIERRKHKNTKQSLALLKALARKKGMTLQEYQKYKTDIAWVALSVGQSDFERKYVDILQKHFKLLKPYKDKRVNGYQLFSTDLNYIRLIKDYTDGHTSHNKHVKNEIYNRSWKFLEGLLDGYLAGDGYYGKKGDLFQVKMTTNYKLYNDLIFISKALGYDVHLHNGYFAKSPSGKLFYELSLSISKNWHRHIALGLVKEHIKTVEDVSKKEAYNLVLKPIYSQDEKRTKFNHLYFTACGLLVSDALKNFGSKLFECSTHRPRTRNNFYFGKFLKSVFGFYFAFA